MNNYNTKAILKKYRLCLLGVFGVFVAIAIIMLVFTDNNFLYGLSLLFGFVSSITQGTVLCVFVGDDAYIVPIKYKYDGRM